MAPLIIFKTFPVACVVSTMSLDDANAISNPSTIPDFTQIILPETLKTLLTHSEPALLTNLYLSRSLTSQASSSHQDHVQLE